MTLRILGKYDVAYFRCGTCQFVQTEKPYWLDEAYQRAINISDVGLVSRSLITAAYTENVIRFFLKSDGRFLDFGGGYGLFVRLMRDAGFDFHRYDKFCQNLMAGRFDYSEFPDERFELITAFEVLEHLTNPMEDVDRMLSATDSLFVSTLLVPDGIEKQKDWWYLGAEHGQHVSLYSATTLSYIAKRLGANLMSNGVDLHLLTRKRINRLAFRFAISRKVTTLNQWFFPRTSLLNHDFQEEREALLQRR